MNLESFSLDPDDALGATEPDRRIHVPVNGVAAATKNYLKRSSSEPISWTLPPPSKRLCSRPPGPVSLSQCMDWAADFMNRMACTNDKLVKNLNHLLERGIDLFTDFSGVGAAEQALALVKEAAQTGCVPHVRFRRACDIRADARQALLLTDGHAAADHILENVLDRLPDSIRAELAELEVAIDAKLQNIFERIDPKKEASRKLAVTTCGKDLLSKAMGILKKVNWKDTCYCCRCDRHCPVHHLDADVAHGRLQIYVAGTTCVHFSAMGLRTCFASDSCIPMLVWLFDTMQHADVIVHENVFGYFGGILLDILADKFVCSFRPFSPTDLGMPTNRPRVYMVATRNTKFLMHPPDLQLPLFEQVFFSNSLWRARCASLLVRRRCDP